MGYLVVFYASFFRSCTRTFWGSVPPKRPDYFGLHVYQVPLIRQSCLFYSELHFQDNVPKQFVFIGKQGFKPGLDVWLEDSFPECTTDCTFTCTVIL